MQVFTDVGYGCFRGCGWCRCGGLFCDLRHFGYHGFLGFSGFLGIGRISTWKQRRETVNSCSAVIIRQYRLPICLLNNPDCYLRLHTQIPRNITCVTRVWVRVCVRVCVCNQNGVDYSVYTGTPCSKARISRQVYCAG